ncbi:MAG TPA: TatD family hydrolase, partial [Chthoniobacterales bacterium]
MLLDTHAHLDYPDYADDLEAVVERAAAAGVTRIISIGTGLASSRRAVALAERFANVFAVVGIHPTNVLDEPEDFLPELREIARHPKVAAIGETGLDYHYLPGEGAKSGEAPLDPAYQNAQAAAFVKQLELANELGLNAVIHQRDAWDDTLRLLDESAGEARGVFHCFGGSPQQAAEVIDRGHLVSFTGIVTFKNAPLVRETAASIPLGCFMVETDCPYLSPIPHRGKRCEPAYTRLVAEKIAEVRGVPFEKI